MVLGRNKLLELIRSGDLVIRPFSEEQVRENGIDLRIGRGYAVQRPVNGLVDICNVDDPRKLYEVVDGDEVVVPPNRFVLVTTEEYVKLPRNVVGFVNLRSTLARWGLVIPPTVVDAGFEGQVTIELVNMSPNTVVIRRGLRFLHLVLVEAEEAEAYASSYRGQLGPTPPKSLRGECSA